MISPERLSNERFIETLLTPIADRIGLMVVDEAHCISDWGHDFRPDYRRIANILRQIPANTPILGTTATANDRVIEDIKTQLGDIVVQRGPLLRDSLALQAFTLPDQASRLAWLAQTIPSLVGSGIVYVLTKRDAEQVAQWLSQQGIDARAYYGNVSNPTDPGKVGYRESLEDDLLNNRLKVLVATTALGMGYDKPDLGFVIHYQAPGSIVSYYQQVGRAGRAIDSAIGVLISGQEDSDIHDYFRDSAFPSENEIQQVLSALEEHDGLSLRGLEEYSNLRQGQIDKVLKLLSVENPAPVLRQDKVWVRTPVPFRLDQDRISNLTHQRDREWQEVQSYLTTKDCLMFFLGRALDDDTAVPCGRCTNCLGQDVLSITVEPTLTHNAAVFLRHAEFPIKPRKQVAANSFPTYGFKGNLPVDLQAEEGRVLSRWGDAGWGCMARDDKHSGHFRDQLVEASVEMITGRWLPTHSPTWVCCVPSLKHPDLVPAFARRVALKLGLPFVDAVKKVAANEAQKGQENRYHQCRNLDGVFATESVQEGPVLLIDDIVDSGWTLTVIAALLRQSGSGPVYPLALASTSTGD